MSSLPVPVTLLSGFLGSGKTTLLKRILQEKDSKGLRVAVLVNDMAELNIDAALVKNTKLLQSKESMVEMHNGCICCTLREDLLIELTKLAVTDKIDAIIVESTGVSEPQQVAETFAFPLSMTEDDEHDHDHDHKHKKTEFEIEKEKEREEKLKTISDYLDKAAEMLGGKQPETLNDIAKLDTCVTVVDCKAFSGDLTSAETLVERYEEKGGVDEEDDRNVSTLLIDQLEFANVVLLNKTDLVNNDEVAKIKKAVAVLNPDARLAMTTQSKVDFDDVVRTGLFNMEEAERSAGWLRSMREELNPETEEYGIASFVYRSRTPFHPKRLMEFLESCFFVNVITYDDEEEEDEDDADDKKDEKKDANGKEEEADDKEEEEEDENKGVLHKEAMQNMLDNYGHIYRSKGFVWIAGRDEQSGSWSQAGTVAELSCNDLWLGLYPRELLPQDDDEEWKLMKKDMQDGIVQDRRQEIVFIGADLKREKITEALDKCLLQREEIHKKRKKDMDKKMNSKKRKRSSEYDEKDLEDNLWKFCWQPWKEGDDPVPTWPDPKEALEAILEQAEEDHKHPNGNGQA